MFVCIWAAIYVQFYYHGNKMFRTFKDVKRYIYLGYPPTKENADEPLVRIIKLLLLLQGDSHIYIYI